MKEGTKVVLLDNLDVSPGTAKGESVLLKDTPGIVTGDTEGNLFEVNFDHYGHYMVYANEVTKRP